MADTRKVDFVSFNGPDGLEYSFHTSESTKSIEMRCDGCGPMGFYDVVYVTQKKRAGEYASCP